MKKAFTILLLIFVCVLFIGCVPEFLGTKPLKVTPIEPVETPSDSSEEPSDQIVGGDKDEHGCIGSAGYSWCENKQKCLRTWEEECVSGDTAVPLLLHEDEARAIAEDSTCLHEGTLSGPVTYNEGTGTWWFDMEILPEFAQEWCNPACVVNEKTKNAEINYRCTGAIPPTEEPIGFCGKSTNGSCGEDTDCTTGGCSGQICQSKNEEPVITTCEYTECYDASKYNLNCGCLSSKCQWK